MRGNGTERVTPPRSGKALLIDLGGRFGGVEKYVVSLAALLEGEAELYVLCVLPELAKRLEAAGHTVIVLPNLGGALKPIRFLIAAAVLPYLLLRHGIRTVQVNGFLEATLMLPARLMGRRTVYTRHGPFETENHAWHRDPLKYVPRALARMSVHLASEVVCVSEAVGAGVRRIRPAVPVTVIPNWIEEQGESQIVRSGAEGPLQVVCASRLERYKGVQLVVEAIRGLEGVKLTVAGEGPYRAELEQMAAGRERRGAGRERPGGPAVEFAGFREEMASIYEAADIFVMPSIGPEGLPMSSLEAMGRGLPCLFSDLPVHLEISDHGRGAMLFRSGDAGSLRNALQAMISDWELRARLGIAAYEIVRERYTAASIRAKYLTVFRAK